MVILTGVLTGWHCGPTQTVTVILDLQQSLIDCCLLGLLQSKQSVGLVPVHAAYGSVTRRHQDLQVRCTGCYTGAVMQQAASIT